MEPIIKGVRPQIIIVDDPCQPNDLEAMLRAKIEEKYGPQYVDEITEELKDIFYTYAYGPPLRLAGGSAVAHSIEQHLIKCNRQLMYDPTPRAKYQPPIEPLKKGKRRKKWKD